MSSRLLTRRKSGLTLVEVLASVTVAAAILAALSAPMAVGIINRRQGQDVTQATNLAQMEIEAIRNNWQLSTLPAAVAGQTPTSTIGQQNYDSNNVTIAWKQAPATGCVKGALPIPTPTTATITSDSVVNNIAVLNDQANIPPNSTNISAALRSVAIDADNDCNQDYWGQVMISNVASTNPSVTASTTGTKRVVVRIFRVQSNPTTLDYVPVNARTSLYNASGIQQSALTTSGGVATNISFLNLPVVVLVADIARS